MSETNPSDPYWDNVVLLIQPATYAVDGSTNIIDATGRTITLYGNTQIDTSRGYPTLLFDGSGDFITVPDADVFDLSSGDWTIDIIGIVPAAARSDFFGHRISVSTYGWMINLYTVLSFNQWTTDGAYNGVVATLPAAGNQFAARITRAGDVTTTAINGVAGTPLTSSNRPAANTAPITIGRQTTSTTAYQLSGHLIAIRITSGQARSLDEVPEYPFPEA